MQYDQPVVAAGPLGLGLELDSLHVEGVSVPVGFFSSSASSLRSLRLGACQFGDLAGFDRLVSLELDRLMPGGQTVTMAMLRRLRLNSGERDTLAGLAGGLAACPVLGRLELPACSLDSADVRQLLALPALLRVKQLQVFRLTSGKARALSLFPAVALERVEVLAPVDDQMCALDGRALMQLQVLARVARPGAVLETLVPAELMTGVDGCLTLEFRLDAVDATAAAAAAADMTCVDDDAAASAAAAAAAVDDDRACVAFIRDGFSGWGQLVSDDARRGRLLNWDRQQQQKQEQDQKQQEDQLQQRKRYYHEQQSKGRIDKIRGDLLQSMNANGSTTRHEVIEFAPSTASSSYYVKLRPRRLDVAGRMRPFTCKVVSYVRSTCVAVMQALSLRPSDEPSVRKVVMMLCSKVPRTAEMDCMAAGVREHATAIRDDFIDLMTCTSDAGHFYRTIEDLRVQVAERVRSALSTTKDIEQELLPAVSAIGPRLFLATARVLSRLYNIQVSLSCRVHGFLHCDRTRTLCSQWRAGDVHGIARFLSARGFDNEFQQWVDEKVAVHQPR